MNEKWMTVGELADKMGVTVRTLQYYDREGLIRPSGTSEGGRRLYDDHDMAKLHQVLSMKFLGFSLKDIKHLLVKMETPADVERTLEAQAIVIEQKISQLEEARETIGELRKEVSQMKEVDWGKYADIIGLLRLRDEKYWVVKYLSDKTMKNLIESYDMKSADDVWQKWEKLAIRTQELQEKGATPEGEDGQALAADWWEMISAVTKGDSDILQNLIQFNQEKDGWGTDMREIQEKIDSFIGPALWIFCERNGIEFAGNNVCAASDKEENEKT